MASQLKYASYLSLWWTDYRFIVVIAPPSLICHSKYGYSMSLEVCWLGECHRAANQGSESADHFLRPCLIGWHSLPWGWAVTGWEWPIVEREHCPLLLCADLHRKSRLRSCLAAGLWNEEISKVKCRSAWNWINTQINGLRCVIIINGH